MALIRLAFKRVSTASNITTVLNAILRTRMKRKKRKIYIAFDLAKAYDIINRQHLFDFLDKGVSTESDHQILNLIKSLYTN